LNDINFAADQITICFAPLAASLDDIVLRIASENASMLWLLFAILAHTSANNIVSDAAGCAKPCRCCRSGHAFYDPTNRANSYIGLSARKQREPTYN
jgi:hypothetical protein